LLEPLAFRARSVEGLGTFAPHEQVLRLTPWDGQARSPGQLPWSDLTVITAA
jgi:hypothetical protein